MEGLSLEQYGIRASKSADIQALNTRLFYYIVLLKCTPATSVFAEIISNYDLVLHRIAFLALQRVNFSKETILCTLTTLQYMVHSVRTSFGDSPTSYGRNIWAIPMTPPPPPRVRARKRSIP